MCKRWPKLIGRLHILLGMDKNGLRNTNYLRIYETKLRKMLKAKLKRKDLVYPDLCYKIIGVLFDVWTDLGFGHKEKFYQKAAAQGFKISNLNFKEQLPAKMYYKNKLVGIYYFDFLIEDKIVLEIKVREYFSKKDINQLYSYLKAKNLKLGLIVHFTRTGVKFKRVVNLK